MRSDVLTDAEEDVKYPCFYSTAELAKTQKYWQPKRSQITRATEIMEKFLQQVTNLLTWALVHLLCSNHDVEHVSKNNYFEVTIFACNVPFSNLNHTEETGCYEFFFAS